MADRTHFKADCKDDCDFICQYYNREEDVLHYCEYFQITEELPIGDYGFPLPHVNGRCIFNQIKKEKTNEKN